MFFGCLILRTMNKKSNKPQAVKFDRRVIDEVQVEPFYGIDLGLPSHRLWTSMNVGASFEEDPGYLMDFDTANAIKFKGSWHMPTKEDFKELVDNCKSEWTLRNGVPGRTFTGKNGNSIFLPAGGWSWFDKDDESDYGTTLDYRGSSGYYWSSSFYSETNAYNLYFNASGVSPQDDSYRRDGFAVRAVQ